MKTFVEIIELLIKIIWICTALFWVFEPEFQTMENLGNLIIVSSTMIVVNQYGNKKKN